MKIFPRTISFKFHWILSHRQIMQKNVNDLFSASIIIPSTHMIIFIYDFKQVSQISLDSQVIIKRIFRMFLLSKLPTFEFLLIFFYYIRLEFPLWCSLWITVWIHISRCAWTVDTTFKEEEIKCEWIFHAFFLVY